MKRITLKTTEEIGKMRESGRILYRVMQTLLDHVRPGVTTRELDFLAKDEILKYNAKGSFKGYNGFPAYICTSVNEEIVHGFPSDRVLEEGDVLSIDAGVLYQGYHADMARTVAVGVASEEANKLIQTAKDCFDQGVRQFQEGNRLFDISRAIQKTAEMRGYSVTRELVGHGIGRNLHEEPSVPNYKPRGTGVRLVTGMVLAIEPMINAGLLPIRWDKNGWTAKTADGSISAHYENTVALTQEGTVILTAP